MKVRRPLFGQAPYSDGRTVFRLDWRALLEALCASAILTAIPFLLLNALINGRKH